MMNAWYTEFIAPQVVEIVKREKPPVDRIRKQRVEKFLASKDDNSKRAEFWLENIIRVFHELSCTPDECMKCVVSLLRDSAYQLWNTLVSVVPRERVPWEFFQEEFKKYISQRFIDQKWKEFLELKQGKMSVTEYEREFVKLSKYARERVSTEAIMCKTFEDGLNEDIKLFVDVLELKELVVPVDRACKAEELSRDFSARLATSARQFPKLVEKDKVQSARAGSNNRGRQQRNPGSGASSKGTPREQAARPEGRAPAWTYVIHAREEASSPDVITGTFSLHDTNVVALIDPGYTHSYICMKLVSSMSIPANLMLLPFDEFDIILGMDWLTTHDATVNCGKKYIEMRCENGNTLCVESDEKDRSPVVISHMSAQRYVRKGYEAYLAFVMNVKEAELKIESVPIVCKYPDVFPEEFLGLPPVREVEFGIELAPGTVPISIAAYKMAQTELKELKAQLQELTDKGLARPSCFTWGAPVLFVKKKDGSMRLCLDYR
ncbi:DNA/RNA polymerases superfamily protein [Gossypium australe]|uniref:DNA/RNA polymerases superfamily protein n=1 Tax=Gossypium australe TaxID=47621 RepID=A0A5B6VXQ7_9ROSI|nr:DNA/RNA polymerases superfamily protein [Gossypium australe]